ncbi:MAG: Dabb family protein [Clostridia bacterium]|nr:Dabb family protein [Clostridia bacterium]
MIKHVLAIKVKDGESIDEMRDVLMSMKGNVPTVKDISVGIDFLHSERSYDILMEVTLENKESLDVYQADEYHCNVVKPYVQSHRSAVVAVDYEI